MTVAEQDADSYDLFVNALREGAKMKFVVIESPFKGTEKYTEEQNIAFARAICRLAVHSGYAPYASHLFFTQPGILRDSDPNERELGIQAGLTIGVGAEEVWFCVRSPDEPYSEGMRKAYYTWDTNDAHRYTRVKHFIFDDMGVLIEDRTDEMEHFLSTRYGNFPVDGKLLDT